MTARLARPRPTAVLAAPTRLLVAHVAPDVAATSTAAALSVVALDRVATSTLAALACPDQVARAPTTALALVLAATRNLSGCRDRVLLAAATALAARLVAVSALQVLLVLALGDLTVATLAGTGRLACGANALGRLAVMGSTCPASPLARRSTRRGSLLGLMALASACGFLRAPYGGAMRDRVFLRARAVLASLHGGGLLSVGARSRPRV